MADRAKQRAADAEKRKLSSLSHATDHEQPPAKRPKARRSGSAAGDAAGTGVGGDRSSNASPPTESRAGSSKPGRSSSNTPSVTAAGDAKDGQASNSGTTKKKSGGSTTKGDAVNSAASKDDAKAQAKSKQKLLYAAAKAAAQEKLARTKSSEKKKKEVEPEDAPPNDQEEEELVDDNIYCVCQTLYDPERMMMACDLCDEWYHVECQGMKESEACLVRSFVCSVCEPRTNLRTTWREKCGRKDCKKASLMPLSRYCSEKCGIRVAADNLERWRKRKLPKGSQKSKWNKLQDELRELEELKTATRRDGLSDWKPHEFVLLSSETKAAHVPLKSANPWHAATAGLGSTPAFDVESLRQGKALDPSIANNVQFLHKITSASEKVEEDIARLRIELDVVRTSRSRVNHAKELLKAKRILWELAKARRGSLPPLLATPAAQDGEGSGGEDGEEDGSSSRKKAKPKSKAKPKKKSAPARQAGGEEEEEEEGEPRCGFDERLGWDDDQLSLLIKTNRWKRIAEQEIPLDGQLADEILPVPSQSQELSDGNAQEGPQPRICGAPYRKCKRHGAWEEIFEETHQKEDDLLNQANVHLTNQETNLSTILEERNHRLSRETERVAREMALGRRARV